VLVGRVAGQSRNLQPHDNACSSQANLGHQLLKSLTIYGRTAGLTKVRIDCFNAFLGPTQGDRALSKPILALGAFGVLKYLPDRGLPHIQVSGPFKMSGVYL
jgi:hypothetical protein